MPNWCDNNLHVKGPEPSLNRLREAVKGTTIREGRTVPIDFSLQSILPMPEGFEDWHGWRMEHWGVKWEVNASYIVVDFDCDELVFKFDTAWSSPLKIVDELKKQYPDCGFSLRYFEPNMRFAGVYEIDQDGIENIVEYSDLDEDFNRFIEKEFNFSFVDDEDVPNEDDDDEEYFDDDDDYVSSDEFDEED
jgi:hypothetical protein